MRRALMVDFGSTFTKLVAVDVDNAVLLGTAQSRTTVETDILDGFSAALARLPAAADGPEFDEAYACSSAAGGLRMVACGFVPELTSEAARLSALGAGAKVVKTYSFELTRDDADEIARLAPDILLLTGGTDGGNGACMLHNAAVLAEVPADFPVVIAGNRSVAAECERLLMGRETVRVENVMPRFGALNVRPAQEAIRSIFLKRIVRAKGLSKAEGLLSGILMPTPAAVLDALTLLSAGTKHEPGLGELVAVDLGGATTDVYSIASGAPSRPDTVVRGLVEPREKRTVEGDMGMRYSVRGIVEAAGAERIAELADMPESRVRERVEYLSQHTAFLPDDDESRRLDFALASLAVEAAVRRHAGSVEEVYTPAGRMYAQTGKDLTNVRLVIGTGGALLQAAEPERVAKSALYSDRDPFSLRPRAAKVLIDKRYILAAMGLLSQKYPDAALTIMKRELTGNGTEQ